MDRSAVNEIQNLFESFLESITCFGVYGCMCVFKHVPHQQTVRV